MTRLDDGTPVHGGGRAAFDYMVELIRELQALTSEDKALGALRAFIGVRMGYQPRYGASSGSTQITPEELTAAIQEFLRLDSEHGKRAQAIVAGLLDVFATPARVESGRINDPSRKYPGDVCVRSEADAEAWDKAYPKVQKWLARHPRWTFHFTPNSASWLNAVEGFFAMPASQTARWRAWP